MNVNATTIDNGLWAIQLCLMNKYGVDTARCDMEPLKWYIGTGRAPTPFIASLLDAKPWMIARMLHKGGSYDDVLKRIKKYVGHVEE